MAYKKYNCNWQLAWVFRRNKQPRGEVDIVKGVALSAFAFRKQSTSYGSAKLITLLFALLLLSACAGLPVRGSVGMQTIETRVDSEVARYYLGSYLAGERSDAALDERIDRVYQSTNGSLPDRNELKHLSDEFSVDFAALYLADQIAHIPVNRRFRRAFDEAYEYARKAFPAGRVSLSAEYEVLVVPTYLYKRFFRRRRYGRSAGGIKKGRTNLPFCRNPRRRCGGSECGYSGRCHSSSCPERPSADYPQRQQVRS